jgi:hypothetical protein
VKHGGSAMYLYENGTMTTCWNSSKKREGKIKNKDGRGGSN